MKHKILLIIIPVLIFSMLFTGCKDKKTNDTSGTTTTTSAEESNKEGKTNQVIYSDETTKAADTNSSDKSKTTSKDDAGENSSKTNSGDNSKTTSSSSKDKTGNNTKAEQTTLAYIKEEMLGADEIINGSEFYEGTEVYTIIKISTLTTDRTYAVSEEYFERINDNLKVTFKSSINAKAGDIVRLKGTFKNNKISNATVLEVNGTAKTEYENSMNERFGAYKKYDDVLTWSKVSSLSSKNIKIYKAKITVTNAKEKRATLEGHSVSYLIVNDNVNLKEGKTYIVYTTALSGKEIYCESDVFFCIGYAEQLY